MLDCATFSLDKAHMNKGVILLVLLVSSFTVNAEVREETAQYIGDLTWKLENGIEITRKIDLSSRSAFKRLELAETSVESDYVSFSGTYINDVFYSDDLLNVNPFSNYKCGSFNFSLLGALEGGAEEISDGLTLYSYSLKESNGLASWYCALDQDIKVNFQQNAQYQSDIDEIYWNINKLVYLHNALLIASSLVVLIFCVYIVKRSLKPLLAIVKAILKQFVDGIAYFVGKIAEAIYTAKNRNTK